MRTSLFVVKKGKGVWPLAFLPSSAKAEAASGDDK